jgi:FHA domain
MLPTSLIDTVLIGTSPECVLRLDDPHVSRKHAQLTFERGRWLIRDLGSRNGLRQDNARRNEFILEPGTEVSLGGITLIAESERFIELREFCCRILGWARERAGAVDQAMRTLRLAATRRTTLVLHGESDVMPVARSLHRHMLGNDRPFIVCDPRRRSTRASVRSAANHEAGLLALAAATGGSLCVRSHRLPMDFPLVLEQLRNADVRVQLFVCSDGPGNNHDFLPAPIIVPPVRERSDELPRIIEEYVRDAVIELGVLTAGLPNADHQWIREHAATTLPEIEKAASRLVALRASCRPSQAADRLGMTWVSLARWFGRRSPLSAWVPKRGRRSPSPALAPECVSPDRSNEVEVRKRTRRS